MRKRFTIKNRLSLITVLCTAALITFLLGNSEPAMNQQVQLTADNNEAITTSFINEQTISSPAESTNENATRVSIAAPETADTNQSVIDNVSQS